VLKSVSLRVLGLLLCLPACLQAQSSGDPQAAAPGQGVVLVLPFENRSGQPNLNWIADSFPDTLNQRLSSAGFLTITRDDRLYALDHLGLPTDFKPTRATTIRIAQTLDAGFVIVGSFNVQNDRIQVQAQVLDVNQLHLSAPLDNSSDLQHLFDAENTVAWKVCRQMNPRFNVAAQTFLSASNGIKLTSFENYIRGISATTPQERVKRLQAAVQESPTYTAAQLALGKELYAGRDFDQAAAVLSKVPRNSRAALEANFFIGLARFNAAKYAEAEAAFAFVASQLPLPEVVNDQAVAQSRQGHDGTPLFQRAVNTDPNDPDYHYNLAVSQYRHSDFASAQHEVDQTLKLRPNDAEAAELKNLISSGHVVQVKTGAGFDPNTRLRRTFSEAGFRQAAFELDQVRAMRLATLPPAQQASEYAQLGREYLAQGLLPEAEQEFNSSLQADARSPEGHAGLAQVREQSGDEAEARKEAQASIAIAPNVNAYLVLARLDLQKNELAASALDVRNALRLEPGNPAAQGMKSALQSRGQSVQ
jgi:TolB-like protein/Flp pilus assembly protein TadD